MVPLQKTFLNTFVFQNAGFVGDVGVVQLDLNNNAGLFISKQGVRRDSCISGTVFVVPGDAN